MLPGLALFPFAGKCRGFTIRSGGGGLRESQHVLLVFFFSSGVGNPQILDFISRSGWLGDLFLDGTRSKIRVNALSMFSSMFVKTTCFRQGTEAPFSKTTVSTTLTWKKEKATPSEARQSKANKAKKQKDLKNYFYASWPRRGYKNLVEETPKEQMVPFSCACTGWHFVKTRAFWFQRWCFAISDWDSDPRQAPNPHFLEKMISESKLVLQKLGHAPGQFKSRFLKSFRSHRRLLG